MRKILSIFIIFSFIFGQVDLHALAPWHEAREYFERLVSGPRGAAFDDPQLAFIMPSKMKFHPDFPRQLYERYSSAREVFDEAMAYYELGEKEFFDLFVRHSAKEYSSVEDWAVRKGAILVLYVALYRVFQEQYNVEMRPYGIMGNSLGMYAAFAASGAIGLRDVLEIRHKIVDISIECTREDFFNMKISDVPLEEVECIGVIYGKTAIKHVDFGKGGLFDKQIILFGELQELEKIKTGLEAKYKQAVVSIIHEGARIAFHTSFTEKRVQEVREILSHFTIRDPQTRIFSSRKDQGYLETAGDIIEEILFSVSHPVRWDYMMEHACEMGMTNLIYLGKNGKKKEKIITADGQNIIEIPLGNMYALDNVKRDILCAKGVMEAFNLKTDFNAFFEFLISEGAQDFLFEGYSGAGKTMLIKSLERYLKYKGYDVITLDVQDFRDPAAYQKMRKIFQNQQDKDIAQLEHSNFIRYELFDKFMKEVRRIRKENRADKVLIQGLQYDKVNEGKPFNKIVRIRPDTVMLFEGNLFLSEEVSDDFDIKIFTDVDLSSDIDINRLIQRGRAKGKSGPEHEERYRQSAENYRRPVINWHREHSMHLYDLILDNTDYNHPVLIQNPARSIPHDVNLAAVISMFRLWQNTRNLLPFAPEEKCLSILGTSV